MPSITAIHHLSLTVTDLERSVRWYTEVLGFAIDRQIEGAGFRRTRLRQAGTQVILTLTQHDRPTSQRFAGTGVGLDHLAFLVPSVADVEAWEQVLERHGVPHSEVKRELPEVARLVFRDPDNIQLEVMSAPSL